MSACMNVRHYRPADATAVRNVHDRVVRAVDEWYLPYGVHDVERTFLANGTFLVVEVRGAVTVRTGPEPSDERTNRTLVATGGFLPGEDGTAELAQVRVAPGYRRRGYARHLVCELEVLARAEGFERIVGASTPGTGLADLYESLGYREYDRDHLLAQDLRISWYKKLL